MVCIRRALPYFILLVLLGFHLHILLQWGEANAQFGRGVCCGYTRPVFQEIHRLNAIGHFPFWTLDRGILPALAAYWHRWGEGGSDFLFQLSVFFLLGSMIWLFLIFKHLKLPEIGLVAVALLPVFPAVAYATRRWDVFVPQMFVILMATYCLLCSRRFTSVFWSILFFGLVVVSAFWSSRETDNLLLLLLMASLSGGALFGGLFGGRDREGKRISRKKILGVFTPIVLICGVFLYQNMHFFEPQGSKYYLEEVQNYAVVANIEPWTLSRLSAYLYYLGDRAVGPWLAWAFWWTLPFLFLRRKMPAELWAAWIPLFFLSLLSKKNHYYISIVWPFLPLVLTLGIAAFPRFFRFPFSGYLLLMACVPYVAKSNPDGALAGWMGRRPWVHGGSGYHALIQTADGGLHIQPNRNRWADRAGQAIAEYIPNDGCQKSWMIIAYDILPVEEIQLRLSKDFPCVQVQNMPPMLQLPRAGMALLTHTEKFQEVEWKLKMEGLSAVGSFVDEEGRKVSIYQRPESWF